MTQQTLIPRMVIAALRGGAGKTFLSIGIIAALRQRGFSVRAFKKGPDYIDAGWLGLASGKDCYNLDPYLCNETVVRASFVKRSLDAHIAIIEGNRGLFDGVDSAGSYSTAELAKSLSTPVIVIVDCTKVTRTAAALVKGCQALDPDLHIKGVILNRVGGARHERVLRESIQSATGIPVVGAVKKLSLRSFPQRHLGLLPLHEHPQSVAFVEQAARIAADSIDLDALVQTARSGGHMSIQPEPGHPGMVVTGPELSDGVSLRIGVLKDSAFNFYYPENLEALQASGSSVVEISALQPRELPDVDALYIGGGFPETHAEELAENSRFKESLLRAIEHGLPVYAECGGLMYLTRQISVDDKHYPMIGCLPVDTVLQRRPQGHGYIRAEVTGNNPFFPAGALISGHEFHYSRVSGLEESDVTCAFRIIKGHGLDGKRDGICVGNVLATYMHVHALGQPQWAAGLLRKAAEYRLKRLGIDQPLDPGTVPRETAGSDNIGEPLAVRW